MTPYCTPCLTSKRKHDALQLLERIDKHGCGLATKQGQLQLTVPETWTSQRYQALSKIVTHLADQLYPLIQEREQVQKQPA